jgi:hypothetical protein
MADLHSKFTQYEAALIVPRAKKDKLKVSRKALQDKIIAYFKQKPGVPVPKFFIQGSYKMGTMILDGDGTYDVDLGVYFLTNPKVTSKTLQTWIAEAVNAHTHGGTQHREKCIRVIYSGDYDIDLPVYVKRDEDVSPWLATKTSEFQKSDPKELCDWFKAKKQLHGAQLVRICRYLKGWARERGFKMPSGIALSVWAANSFGRNIRDDIAFLNTLKAIKSQNLWSVTCKCPATPGDDLTAKLDLAQKQKFKDALTSLIADGETAVATFTDTVTASKLWRKHLGSAFPL